MTVANVQQFFDANPVLAIMALVVVGIILVLAARILVHTAGCAVHVGCAVVILVVIFLLLRMLLFHV